MPTTHTTARDFFYIGPSEPCLFSVRAGIPAEDALEVARCQLSSAIALARTSASHYNSGNGRDAETAQGVVYLLENIQGILESLESSEMELPQNSKTDLSERTED